ncbi:MAG TPA: protein-L-isoaspartate O-methyltransferase [Polyangiales bacterium]|jgi:protein-L-isoaspartate(D-aspartate) O-methyltransferase|nr:protein-L-isoaspartate O-methyltransferase [Polyangiales bacterium]
MNTTHDQAAQYQPERRRMVERLRSHGIRDARLLDAMYAIPRHCFEPEFIAQSSYEECAWPINREHTLVEPYYIARACELAHVAAGDHALVIGAGAGYCAAVLARLCEQVTLVELVDGAAGRTRQVLRSLRIDNVQVVERRGDGGGVPSGPYDAIVLSASVTKVPQALVDELAPAGRLVAPVGQSFLQSFVVLRKLDAITETSFFDHCIFTPLPSSFGLSRTMTASSARAAC